MTNESKSRIMLWLFILFLCGLSFFAGRLKADGITTVPGPDGFDQITVLTDGPNFLAWAQPDPGFTPPTFQLCWIFSNSITTCQDPFQLNWETSTVEDFTSTRTGAEVQIVDPFDPPPLLATPEPATIVLGVLGALFLMVIGWKRFMDGVQPRYKPSDETEHDPW